MNNCSYCYIIIELIIGNWKRMEKRKMQLVIRDSYSNLTISPLDILTEFKRQFNDKRNISKFYQITCKFWTQNAIFGNVVEI